MVLESEDLADVVEFLEEIKKIKEERGFVEGKIKIWKASELRKKKKNGFLQLKEQR
jgi:hypothetical protein